MDQNSWTYNQRDHSQNVFQRITECALYYSMLIMNHNFELAHLRRIIELLNTPAQHNFCEILISLGKISFICGFIIGIILGIGSNPMVFGIILVLSIVTISNFERLEDLRDQENEINS